VRPGTQRYAFTYVKDLTRGIIVVGNKGRGDGYPLGQTRTYSILQIAKAFGVSITFGKGYPGRAKALNNPRKARALGWRPAVDVMRYIRAFVTERQRGRLN
jgi:UDP-glucose 4-epimerase